MMKEPLLIRAYRGEQTERPPVWLMRQAGRYLPEYREIRKRMGMLDAIRDPKTAAEITLQPIRRFGMDGAIIFADILNPLLGMGIKLDFIAGEGPKIFNPIETAADVAALKIPDVQENVGYTLEALSICASELHSSGTALIGFAGAPFTLSTYMLADRDTQTAEHARSFMLQNPQVWAELQEKLAEMTIDYLTAQAQAGAQAVQLFDSWIGNLGPEEFERFAAPYVRKIIDSVQRNTGVPVIYFGTGTAGIFGKLAELGAEALGVDWRTPLALARAAAGANVTLQGNLDPVVLAGPRDYLEQRLKALLDQGRACGRYVCNLGHGILPHTPIENVKLMVEAARSFEKNG